nr:15092_t:CDS:2 [Entrophospora candida]
MGDYHIPLNSDKDKNYKLQRLVIAFQINQIIVTFGQFTPVPRYAASSQTIGDRLYVIGGQVSAQASVSSSLATKDVIYLKLSTNFSRNSPTWIDHTQISPLPVFNSWAGSCKDKDNKTIYLFGGFIQDINTSGFTATYLPKSKLIIYIGGTEVGPNGISRNVNIKENAGGAVIENRYSHSAALTSDDRIICYGGLRNYNLIGSKPELALAPVNTTANQPPSLVFHNAELYQDTMFIVFGNLTTQLGNLNREIFLFDTKSYTWMANFQPNPDNSSPTNSNSTSTNDGGGSGSFVPSIIAGIASLVVIISGILVAFYILKRRKSKAEKIIEMPSSSDYNKLSA